MELRVNDGIVVHLSEAMEISNYIIKRGEHLIEGKAYLYKRIKTESMNRIEIRSYSICSGVPSSHLNSFFTVLFRK